MHCTLAGSILQYAFTMMEYVMFRKTYLYFTLFSIVLLICCSRDFSTFPVEEDTSRPLTRLEKELAESGNDFGFRLFKEIVRERADSDSNIFISPLSVSFALGMTYNGAATTTEEAMRTTLGFDYFSKEQINETFQSLMTLLTGLDPKVRFQIANSIWYRLGFHVEQPFIDVNKTYFDAEVEALDFSSQQAIDTINDWVYQNTNGKIEEIIDNIHPLTVMFLLNAIYFKADWTFQFDPDMTADHPFTLADGSDVTCKMMQQEGDFEYFESDDFQAVDLPYGNGGFSMTIFLPRPQKTLDGLIAEFSPENWAQWTGQFYTTKLHLFMPRLKVEFEMKLNDVLKTLGMGIAFSGAADFIGINKDGGLYISMVKHKTFVEVDEEGTEAAAVTIVEIRETSAGPGMMLNRPFVFVIRERASNTIVFMGKIVNPVE